MLDRGCYQFENTRNAYSLCSETSCKNTDYKNEKDKWLRNIKLDITYVILWMGNETDSE
jgi:hypothetical protein